MIVYFSSTGNCKFAAERLALETGDRAASILDIREISLKNGERLGFVFPTYFWRLPSIVDEYMQSVVIRAEEADPYVYFVVTYGSTCGQTATYMKRHLKKKGLKLSAAFSVKTADDWTVWYDMNDKAAVEAVLKEEAVQLDGVVESVKARELGFKLKNTLPMIAVMGSNYFYKRARRTKHLHVEEGCIGCGLCERECPTSSIKIKDGKPVWVKERCTMCLHCLHFCPKFAIQYDDKTKEHGQYKHP